MPKERWFCYIHITQVPYPHSTLNIRQPHTNANQTNAVFTCLYRPQRTIPLVSPTRHNEKISEKNPSNSCMIRWKTPLIYKAILFILYFTVPKEQSHMNNIKVNVVQISNTLHISIAQTIEQEVFEMIKKAFNKSAKYQERHFCKKNLCMTLTCSDLKKKTRESSTRKDVSLTFLTFRIFSLALPSTAGTIDKNIQIFM